MENIDDDFFLSEN